MTVKSLDVLLNYNFEASARSTRKVLAVVKCRGGKERMLKEVDLKTVSLWARIKYCLSRNLSKKTVGVFVARNMQDWKNQVATDLTQQVKLEKQCARLERKHFSLKNPFRWSAHFKITSSDGSVSKNEIIFYDRLTTNQDILNDFNSKQIPMKVHKYTFDFKRKHFDKIFGKCAFEGDYRGSTSGFFIRDEEKGGDRFCQVHFSELNQSNLMDLYTKTIERVAYRRGHSQGYSEGYSAGYSEGIRRNGP